MPGGRGIEIRDWRVTPAAPTVKASEVLGHRLAGAGSGSRYRDMAAHQPPIEGNLLPSPQPETTSFPMRTQADHDAFVTLPESPAGRPKAFTPGFLVSRLPLWR